MSDRKKRAFRPGDTVSVAYRIIEGGKERIQNYEGIVIGIKGIAESRTFTVRKISFGVGVERIFPISSPRIASVKVITRGRTKRAKLYYLRQLKGKKAQVKERLDTVARKTKKSTAKSKTETSSTKEKNQENEKKADAPNFEKESTAPSQTNSKDPTKATTKKASPGVKDSKKTAKLA